MLTQAKSAPGMVLNAARLDADPYALCTPDGIVDLRTSLVKTPDPNKDFHSRSTSVGPQQMPTPRWNRFLTDTFGDDAEGHEMIGFLQLLLGYSVTGDVGGQVLPFLFGSGKNGKSVLLDVLMKLLGDYADAAPPGFLMARPYEGHPTDLAELHGRRVIVCSEVKHGDKFDEARVKLLTGGDRIKARRMRQDFFSFEPTHHLWLLGNHRPEVGTGGFAFWRRMRLIPFERVVSDNRKIDNLADILVTEEGPGILGWLIDGARRYLAGDKDLTGPARVRIATTAYAETEDHTGRFFGECCTLAPELRAEQAGLYAAYKTWCQNEGAPANHVLARICRPRPRTGRPGLTQGDDPVQPAQVLPGHRTAHRRREGSHPMSSLITEDEISHETELVWLEDITDLDYVRQSLDRLPTRRGKPAYHRDGRMVGYALLGPGAKASRSSGTFRRRVFWLLPHDRDTEPEGLYATGAPAEAVDPRTLTAGTKGYKTERSEGGLPSTAMQELGITLPL
jgi:P4 family phage/plasmid primase-like protien